jgi:uncharacterized integral membrane protein
MSRAQTQSAEVTSAVDKQRSRDRMKVIVGLVSLGILILFLLQNLQEVDIHFLWFDWSTRMVWALLASSVVGALATVAFSTIRRRRTSER